MSRHKLLFVAMAVVLTLVPVYSQSPDISQSGLEDPEGLQSLKYRLIGPAWGGRVSRVAGIAGNPNVYFMATASGGVWKSDNGGTQWKPVFDKQPISSIGSIAVAPSDPNVVYVGSGEANIRGNVAAGNGIYKSTDGGNTWSHVWKQEGQIGTMEALTSPWTEVKRGTLRPSLSASFTTSPLTTEFHFTWQVPFRISGRHRGPVIA